MQMSSTLAATVALAIPVLLFAGLVEIRQTRENLDSDIARSRELIGQVETSEPSHDWRAELRGLRNKLQRSENYLVAWLIVAGGGAIAEVLCFVWMGRKEEPWEALAWLSVIDIGLLILFLIIAPLIKSTGGPLLPAGKDNKSELNYLVEDIKACLTKDRSQVGDLQEEK